MQRDQSFSVIGLRENGERVVITTDVTHSTAERVMNLMIGSSGFADLFVEADGDNEAPIVDSAACDDRVPAGVTQNE